MIGKVTLTDMSNKEIQITMGGDRIRTASCPLPFQVDSLPMIGDLVECSSGGKSTHSTSVLASVDGTDRVAGDGEIAVYSRGFDGTRVAQVHMKGDGSILITSPKFEIAISSDGSADFSNGYGGIKVLSSGAVDINGVTIDTAGKITTTASVVTPSAIIGGRELANHTHTAGTPPGSTGVNL